jgi:hypothetical protein
MTIKDTSEIKDSKTFKKYIKLTSEDMGKELLKKTPEELRKILAECDIYEFEVKSELKAQPNYQKICEQKKDLEGGLKDVLSPIKAKRQLALDLITLLEEK